MDGKSGNTTSLLSSVGRDGVSAGLTVSSGCENTPLSISSSADCSARSSCILRTIARSDTGFSLSINTISVPKLNPLLISVSLASVNQLITDCGVLINNFALSSIDKPSYKWSAKAALAPVLSLSIISNTWYFLPSVVSGKTAI